MDERSNEQSDSNPLIVKTGPDNRCDRIQQTGGCFGLGYKKILLLLALLQLLGVGYLYRTSGYFIEKSSEAAPLLELYSNLQSHEYGTIFHLPLTRPADMGKYYVEVSEDVWCLNLGVKTKESKAAEKCICLEGWSGSDCGVPYSVWDSGFLQKGAAKGIKVQRRQQPRRIIYSIAYHGESDLLNQTLWLLDDLVDIFLIGAIHRTNSSNSSQLDNSSPIHGLLPSELVKKIVFIPLRESRLDKFELVLWMQQQIWNTAKHTLSDLRPDDMVVMSDSTLFPLANVLSFFKLYDGFSEPVFFHSQSINNVYSLSNLTLSSKGISLSPNITACTFEFLRYICGYDAQLVWAYESVSNPLKKAHYEMNHKKILRWDVGSIQTPAGLSCVGCTFIPPTAISMYYEDKNVTLPSGGGVT